MVIRLGINWRKDPHSKIVIYYGRLNVFVDGCANVVSKRYYKQIT